jgi:hypothetical protein
MAAPLQGSVDEFAKPPQKRRGDHSCECPPLLSEFFEDLVPASRSQRSQSQNLAEYASQARASPNLPTSHSLREPSHGHVPPVARRPGLVADSRRVSFAKPATLRCRCLACLAGDARHAPAACPGCPDRTSFPRASAAQDPLSSFRKIAPPLPRSISQFARSATGNLLWKCDVLCGNALKCSIAALTTVLILDM